MRQLVLRFKYLQIKAKDVFIFDRCKNEDKKAKSLNRNIVATISNKEYKVFLLNEKCLRHSMNRIQSKDHKIGTYEINKISLSFFDDKIYVQNNVSDGLVLGYQSSL